MTSFSIQLNNLTLHYQNDVLFQNLNLTLPEAQCIALLGPSGVGKTSLLHRIAELDLAQGTIFSGSIQASDNQSLQHRVMLMTQQDALLPWLTALENVLLGYRLRHELSIKNISRAKVLLQEAGLKSEDFLKKPSQLSGGMRQRIALVRTLMENKPVLLLDEPFSALDAITRYKLQEIAARMWHDKTVLLITHDPLEALRLADQIYIMRGRPAVLEKIIMPQSKPPRQITTEFAEFQARILEVLSER